MKKHYVVDLKTRIAPGQNVELYGWVKSRRCHGQVIFLDICDSTGSIQAVIDTANGGASSMQIAKRVTVESAVKVGGVLVQNCKIGCREIATNSLEIVGEANLDISPHPHEDIDIFDPRLQETLLDRRHFFLRNPKVAAILRFRHLLLGIVQDWFRSHGFIQIDAPILTPTPLYDDNTPIGVDVHDQHVYLTQCVGFYLEHAVHAFEKIYNIGPSFRAEESRSKRHLMEYWHIKAELAFVDIEDLVATVEDFIQYVTERSCKEGVELATTIGKQVCTDGLAVPFPRIEYPEAIEWLTAQGIDIEFGKSLGSEEEALLSTRFGNTPFWVVGIPRTIEPFPYVIDPVDRTRTRTADLIASRGFGELLGIAEKITDPAMLDERLAEKGKLGDPRYEWLRDLRRYGCVPHGGFGMGVERLIRWLLQVPHVRDTIPFHRTFGRKIHP